MYRLTALAAALVIGTGCVYVAEREVVYDSGGSGGTVAPSADAPFIRDAAAGCDFDEFNMDEVWWFEADVSHPRGPLEVVQVWADIWDDRADALVVSVELFPEEDPYLWFSDWLGTSLSLDCAYPHYSVDFVAYDTQEDWDAVTVFPYTY